MSRLSVRLKDDQDEWLEQAHEETGKAKAVLIREAIDDKRTSAASAEVDVDLDDTLLRGYRRLLELTDGGGLILKSAADPELAQVCGRSSQRPKGTQGPARSRLEAGVIGPLQRAGLLRVQQGIQHVAYDVLPPEEVGTRA